MLLAIDTSTSWASLALLDLAGTVLARHSWHIGQQHSVAIFGALDSLLESHGVAKEATSAVAVATGPGSFNGTRVAVTVAKTLAFTWRVPLIGVTTLDGIAQAAFLEHAGETPPDRLLAMLEAGRDELYTAWYDLDQPIALVRRQGEITLARIEDISPVQAGDLLVCGEISDAHRDALQARLVNQVVFAAADQDRAVGVGILALARLAAGQQDDPLALEPTYVRRPNITTSARHPMVGEH
jgi:tRNA threonylcarbamoyladenosine biosynthesis protein TsaB